MDYGSDRRREPRFPIHAEATLSLATERQTVPATTGNLSGSGVYLRLLAPFPLSVGDEVTCEFQVRHGSEDALPCWGVGKVVRVEGLNAAVELTAGGFAPPESPDAA